MSKSQEKRLNVQEKPKATEKPTAHIEDWSLEGSDGNLFLLGTITKHPRQEAFRGKLQQTSRVVNMDVEAGTCETQNTNYTLGKASGETPDYTHRPSSTKPF